ncbi:hypothetical protein K503DRAFT_775080 [Rhizopogon vinicolor AM-OR11-026]|uniref:Uncharacterized protein n=1 Tax=Rhizopogon vinicolor AM-OR11-026 TaxID=1314800 RepID=A0A1B7MMU0_9AGAM|nr:hypothetical protein K503DRAFT_775080 [Rhizopogon vinicolor AM-OR11-026]
MQGTRMIPQSPSSLDIDTMNLHALSGFDEFNEERNDPYENFFQSSQSNLSSSSDASPRRRFWKVLRPPVNMSMRFQGRLKRHLFARRSGENDTARAKDTAGVEDITGGKDTAGGEGTAGGKDTTGENNTSSVSEAPAKVARGPSSEVVEVYAVRGFRRLVVVKRKRKTEDSSSDSSDSSIQGGWHKFLVKICYPCGRYY